MSEHFPLLLRLTNCVLLFLVGIVAHVIAVTAPISEISEIIIHVCCGTCSKSGVSDAHQNI